LAKLTISERLKPAKGRDVKREAIDQDLDRYRRHALHFAELLAAGLRFPELVGNVRAYMEDLICLMEEAPDDRRAEIEYLIDRFDELQRRLVN
jgi:hypothetical protein